MLLSFIEDYPVTNTVVLDWSQMEMLGFYHVEVEMILNLGERCARAVPDQ